MATTDADGPGAPDGASPRSRERASGVPAALVTASSVTWRLLVLALGAWVFLLAFDRLVVVAVPIAAGLLLTALGYPLIAALRRLGLPAGPAALVSALLVLGVAFGVGYLVVTRAISEAPQVVDQFTTTVQQLPITNSSLQQLEGRALDFIRQHQSDLTSGVYTTLRAAGELLTGLVLTLFVTIYLLYDGPRVWSWFVRLVPAHQQDGARAAGRSMWHALAGWVRGTAVIAAFHGVVVGVTLALMGVPLVAVLAVLVFIGSFVPIIGSVIFGGIAVLVTFATHGWVLALVLVGVLLFDNQVESHVLQPFLVGRYVRLHPLVVVLVIAAGGVLEGLVGAVLAVPLTAAVHAALDALHPRGPQASGVDDPRPWRRRTGAHQLGGEQEAAADRPGAPDAGHGPRSGSPAGPPAGERSAPG